jgi:hypothetical protein
MPFLGMPHRGHPRRLFDDDDVVVQVTNLDVGFFGRWGEWMSEDVQHVAGRQPPTFVDAEVAVDLHVSRVDQPSRLPPGHLKAAVQSGYQRVRSERFVDLNDARLLGIAAAFLPRVL